MSDDTSAEIIETVVANAGSNTDCGYNIDGGSHLDCGPNGSVELTDREAR